MSKTIEELAYEMGLSKIEWQSILKQLGREPNLVETGVFSSMWSEHCSYKSSKPFLRKLPTKAPWVLIGPGENAGAVSIGDGQAIIFKMESHNHPSYIEPFQGAATGVGGIMRDVFTMGARPIANLNCLRFGDLSIEKNKHLLERVVEGISFYGNCMGVPTVGGDLRFDERYNGNCLVNAFCMGIADEDKIFLGLAEGVGNKVIYVGAKTGRDGIHGATMASESFEEGGEDKKPTVQVGDPFMEKLLLEACLELMQEDAIVGIQDMGAAGLTSSSVEMAGRAGNGLTLNLDKVPSREENMTPYEFMLSESQERMLMILKPGKYEIAERVFKKWDLEIAEIGVVDDTGNLNLNFNGEKVGELPIDALLNGMPDQKLNFNENVSYEATDLEVPAIDLEKSFAEISQSGDLADKNPVFKQYDHMILCGTARKPSIGAAVVKVPDSESEKYVALSGGCMQFFVYLDSFNGSAANICKFATDLIVEGAKPLAITDCLNFGNPKKPEILTQFKLACEGMADAGVKLDIPVISGNVSLYNENQGVDIHPTPMVALAGLIDGPYHGKKDAAAGDRVYLWKKPSGKIGGSLLHRKLFRDLKLETPVIDYDSIIALRDFAVDGDFLGEFKGLYSIGMGGSLHLLSRLLGKAKLGLNCKNDLTNAELYSEDPGNVIMIISPDSNPRLIEQLDKTHFYLGDVSDDQGLTFSNGKNFDWSLKGENPLGFLDL